MLKRVSNIFNLPLWMLAILLIPVIFSAWCVFLMLGRNELKERIDGDITLSRKMGDLEQELRNLYRGLPDGSNRSNERNKEWQELRSTIAAKISSISAEGGSYFLINENIRAIEGKVGELDKLHAELLSLEENSREKAGLETQFRLTYRSTIDESYSAARKLRETLSQHLSQVSQKWNQLNVLAIISIFLSFLAGLLLVFYQRNLTERKQLIEDLRHALGQVRQLQGILPICGYCKNIRDDGDYWQRVESYISKHSEAKFSHAICPDCYEAKVKPELEDFKNKTLSNRNPDPGSNNLIGENP